jgi:hypothetical protein
MGENILKIIFLIRDLYLQYKKDSYHSVITQLKMGRGSRYPFTQRKHTEMTHKHTKDSQNYELAGTCKLKLQ